MCAVYDLIIYHEVHEEHEENNRNQSFIPNVIKNCSAQVALLSFLHVLHALHGEINNLTYYTPIT